MSDNVESPAPKGPATARAGGDVPDAAGVSLWRDAWRRLLRNKAALVGASIVLAMAFIATFADAFAAHVTRFTPEETRSVDGARPPGARSVPREYTTFYSLAEVSLAAMGADAHGTIGPAELSATLQRLEFERFDRDGDGVISRDEFERASHGLVGITFDDLDQDGDGVLSPAEAALFTNVMPHDEARQFIHRRDIDGDGRLAVPGEIPGLPRPQVHLLGTDDAGRDLLTRVIHGGRISLAVGVLATLVSLVIGVTWGAVAGFAGGRVDNVMMRIVDVLYGIPFMFLVILLVVAFGRNIILLFIALGAVQWLTMSRIVRGQVISLKHREFVEAAEAIGVSKLTIVFRHLIPNALGPIIVYSTLLVPTVMLEEAFLSFLGLGVQPPYASWGTLLAAGREGMELYPWLMIWPGIALALTLLSFNFLGDGLRDALDPQSKKD